MSMFLSESSHQQLHNAMRRGKTQCSTIEPYNLQVNMIAEPNTFDSICVMGTWSLWQSMLKVLVLDIHWPQNLWHS